MNRNHRQTSLHSITPMPGKPARAKPQWRMRVSDAGMPDVPGEAGEQFVEYSCPRCGHLGGWHEMPNVTAAKRGLPCPVCNSNESTK